MCRTNQAFSFRFQISSLILLLMLAFSPAPAQQSQDDEYLRIFNRIQEADALSSSGQTENALAKYRELYAALEKFRRTYPEWNKQVVNYRLNYLVQQITSLNEKITAAQNAAAQAAKPTETAPQQPGSVQQVKLLEPGAEPRQELRLHPAPGEKQSLALVIRIATAVQMAQMQGQSVKMPPMKMSLEATVKDVSEEGTITYDLAMGEITVVDEPGTGSEAAEAMRAALGGIKGFSGTATVTSRGLTRSTEMKLAANADSQTRQVMEQMKDLITQIGTPFPEEAVGPGAKWEVAMPLKSQGLTIDQTSTYELVSLEEGVATVSCRISQRASNQKVQNPAMPAMKMDMTKLTGKGTSQVKLDLGRLLPVEGTADSQTEMNMSIDAGGQKQTMTVKMDMKLTLESQ
jgi:hypothetical protein